MKSRAKIQQIQKVEKSGEIRIRMLVGALKCKYYVKRHGKRKKIKISTEGEFRWMREEKKNCVHKWKKNTRNSNSRKGGEPMKKVLNPT